MVRTSPSNAEGAGSIPGQEAKILHASWPKNQNIKHKQYCNEFNKDFSDGPCKKKIFKKIKYTILVKVFFSVFNGGDSKNSPGVCPSCVIL